jgi:hypothetical protein
MPQSATRLSFGRLLLGKPLATEALPHQAVSRTVGLAVFASDALSSTAYATEEILFILALAGTALILLMAANTSYADFPRLAAVGASEVFSRVSLPFVEAV